ncbi:hypothetical protein INR49_022232, partial [Caranx melampygus]
MSQSFPATGSCKAMLSLSITLFLAATCSLVSSGYSGQIVTTCDFIHRLSCADFGVISVESALFGRKDRETCGEGKSQQETQNTDCSLDTAVDHLKRNCNGKNSCTIKASNGVFGDPCVGTYKYLEVSYACQ